MLSISARRLALAAACLLLLFAGRALAVTRTVCASGCDYTTLAAAYAACGSTDVIELRGNISENLIVNKNIAGITSDTGSRIWTNSASGGNTLGLTKNITQPFLLSNLIIQNVNCGTNGRVIEWTTVGGGSKLTIQQCEIVQSCANDAIAVLPALTAVDQFKIDRCLIWGTALALNGIYFTNQATANTILITNCIIRDFPGAGRCAISQTKSGTKYVVKVHNNTLAGCNIGISLASYGTIQNNLFVNNADDVLLSGSGIASNFTYNAFEEQVSGFGTNNIFGVNPMNEFVNEAVYDYHLKAGAQCIDSGITVAQVTADYDGVVRPQWAGHKYDISAYERVQTPTSTITNTNTSTATMTITRTITVTITPTVTASITPTATITRTATVTVTGTITQTATATITGTGTPTVTSTVTKSVTPSISETGTSTITGTATPTVTYTETRTITATATQTITLTNTKTVTETVTPIIHEGSVFVMPDELVAGSAGNTIKLEYNAGPTSWGNDPDFGTLQIRIPDGWSSPSLSPANAGYFTVECRGGTVTSKTINGQIITVKAYGLPADTGKIIIMYGSLPGPGAQAQGSPGYSYFLTSTDVTNLDGEDIFPIIIQPYVLMIPPTPTITPTNTPMIPGEAMALPSFVTAGSTGNTIRIKYDKDMTGWADLPGYGTIILTIPNGWSVPDDSDILAPGFFDVDVKGGTETSRSVSGQDIIVNVHGLPASTGSVEIIYGLKDYGGPGAAAQGNAGNAEFTVRIDDSNLDGNPFKLMDVQPFVNVLPPTQTITETNTATRTCTPSATGTITATGTPTCSATDTKTITATVTYTITKTVTMTMTASATVTATSSGTITFTGTLTATSTFTVTVTHSNTVTVTGTVTMSVTATCTKTITVTQTASSTPTITSTVIIDAGQAVVFPGNADSGSTGNRVSIEYSAGASVWGSSPNYGILQLRIPDGWSLPSMSPASPGYFTVDVKGGTLVSRTISGQIITIKAYGLPANTGKITVCFGALPGPGALAPSSPGASYFITGMDATNSDGENPVPLIVQPYMMITGATPTCTPLIPQGIAYISPYTVPVGSSGNTIRIIYSNDISGWADESGYGTLSIKIPDGWSPPNDMDIYAPGFFDVDVKGGTETSRQVIGSDIVIKVQGLPQDTGSIEVVYGIKAYGGPGAVAQGAIGNAVFEVQVDDSDLDDVDIRPLPEQPFVQVIDFISTVTITKTAVNTASQTPQLSFTASPTVTVTATITRTNTITATFTRTFSVTPTSTASITQIISATFTITGTRSITGTITGTATASATPVLTIAQSGTETSTATFTYSVMFSPSATVTSSMTPTESITSFLNTFTRTLTATLTCSATTADTSTATRTQTPQQGQGTASISPMSAISGTGGYEIRIVYTAGPDDWAQLPEFGILRVTIPEGWTAPSFTSDAGYVSVITSAFIALKQIAGNDIIIYLSGLNEGQNVTVVYGDKNSGGTGATAGPPGNAEFSVATDTDGVNPSKIAVQPYVNVGEAGATSTITRTMTPSPAYTQVSTRTVVITATMTNTITAVIIFTQTPTVTKTITLTITLTPSDTANPTAVSTPAVPAALKLVQNGVNTELRWNTASDADYYKIYSSTGAKGKLNIFPAGWNIIATVPPTTGTSSYVYVDTTGNTYTYYAVTAINGGGESQRSGTGTKIIFWFLYTEGGKNTYRLSLPYAHQFSNAAEIISNIEGSVFAQPVKIDNISKWNPFTQSFIPYGYNKTAGIWMGINWEVDAGTCSSNAIYFHAISSFSWIVAGSDTDTCLKFCFNTNAPNANKRILPYSCIYTQASDIINEIEGGTDEGKNVKINKIGLWNETYQSYVVFGYNDSLKTWGGTNFEIKPGNSINIYPSGNASEFIWTPKLVSTPIP